MSRSKAFDYHPVFNRTTLKNGVRVVTEHHPFTRSVSAGIYVDLGTRDEPAHLGGAAHFIEHLVFKGTRKRTGFEIAKSLEEVGGDLNAYTSREYTCFHAACLREHLPLAMDVLVDLISRARFNKNDFDTERDVVSAEIDMSMDDFEEYIYDLFFENAYQGHALGKPILGTPTSLKSMDRTEIMKYYQSRYRGSNLVVSVAGNVDHDQVVDVAAKALGSVRGKPTKHMRRKPRFKTFRRFIHRPSEQVHILMGGSSCAYQDEYRFESYIVNALLGGGMTSKLYQSVREKRGLAYTVYSFLISFTDSGLLTYYASTAPKNVAKVMKLMQQEIFGLRKRGINNRDLQLFKTQVKGQILLGADDVENRMNSLAVNEMIFGQYRPVDEIINDIDKITVKSVQEYLNQYVNEKELGVLLLGDMERTQAETLLDSF
ncbi:MAG: M16 family metallopeptidase [Bdellovibrionales bacterium]